MGCQEDAGILKGGKLSDQAKNKLFTNISNEMNKGTTGLGFKPFSCGKQVKPIQGASNIDLTNESTFGDFQKNVVEMYEQIAIALNFNGQFMFAPVVVDPVALALAIDPPEIPDLKFPDEFLIYSLGLPLIAVKLGFPLPANLASKLPSIVVSTLPAFNFKPPNVKIPEFIDLFNFSFWQAKMPNLLASLAPKIPSIFAELLAFKFDSICSAVSSSGLFGEPGETSTMQIVVAKNLSQCVAECVMIAIVALTLGSAPGGIVGGLGRYLGYVPPTPARSRTRTPRARIVESMKSATNTSWSGDRDDLSASGDALSAKFGYTNYCYPMIVGNGDVTSIKSAFNQAQGLNCAIPFVRSALFAGGGIDDFFLKPNETTSYDDLRALIVKKGASIGADLTTIPQLKMGDVIIAGTSENVVSFISKDGFFGNLGDSFNVTSGGQVDSDNEGAQTSINDVQVMFMDMSGVLSIGTSSDDAIPVQSVIDVELLINS